MATTMAPRGGMATWCCILAAALVLGSVMGEDDDEELVNMQAPPPSPGDWQPPPPGKVPPSPSNWDWDVPPSWDGTPPVSQVTSYQNGHPAPVDYKKPNRIFICDDDFGQTCVTQCPDECPLTHCQISCSYCETRCGMSSRSAVDRSMHIYTHEYTHNQNSLCLSISIYIALSLIHRVRSQRG
jgi:hypothetical protein